MMRRGSKWSNKKVDPNAPPPPVDPRSPPAKPKDLVKAQGVLQELLLGREVMVAPGFGFGDMSSSNRDAKWRLYVFTNETEKTLPLPPEVMEFEVIRREARIVPPPWGRAARN